MSIPITPLKITWSIVSACLLCAPLLADVQRFQTKDSASQCIAVSATPLIHSTQITADGSGDLSTQTKSVIERTRTLLKNSGCNWDDVIKINVYLALSQDFAEIGSILNASFPEGKKPVISYVSTPLRVPNSKIAMDVIATSTKPPPRRSADISALEPGARVYISGQAEKGDGTIRDATTKTLESLGRTLRFLGLGKEDSIQVKCFINDMAQSSESEQAMAEWFGGGLMAPVSFVEWISPLPVEIEMIASAKSLSNGPSLEVRTPPGMTSPNVYSRLTIARHPTTIFTSGIYPNDPSANPSIQLRSLFSNLKRCLDLAGSDWTHLVKATYYVSEESLSKEHNAVRPDYFSPRRPPAASKASVHGVGRQGHGITMDFIAVPGEP